MSTLSDTLSHDHVFLGEDHRRNERRVWLVIAITTLTMLVEIVAGTVYGSMALVADGWHMSTHAGAMLIAAFAYRYARQRARDPRFTFGTGKLGDLAAFASAILLALIALLIGWESLLRFVHPVAVSFPQAIAVAVGGLAVNLVCALVLKGEHHPHAHPGHGHGDHGHHDHGHGHRGHGQPAAHAHHDHDHGHPHAAHAHPHQAHAPATDNNFRAAYMHVLADALTSVLAIVALVLGSLYGWIWLDAAMGVVGALVIARWSRGLIAESGKVLLDFVADQQGLPADIRRLLAAEGDRITDLHVWQVGPGHHAAIVALVAAEPRAPAYYKQKLAALAALSHVTVEVSPATAA